MSRPWHLPPRCPPQNRSPLVRSASQDAAHWEDAFPGRFQSLRSQSSLPEEMPSWLDDLLSESEEPPRATPLRRAVSDPVAILEAAAAYQSSVFPFGEGNGVLSPSLNLMADSMGGSGRGLEANCVYGPNSPRKKSVASDSESSMVTTALLGSVPQNPLLYLSTDFLSGYGATESGVRRDDYIGAGDTDPDTASRRRSGQRSRVRKLQYIAELERTVEQFQAMGAELAARVASHFQQRVALSQENKKLKQQVAILRQEKMIKDGQYKSLKNEADKLKGVSGRHRKSKSAASCLEMGYAETDGSGSSWQILDMGKLSLHGNPIPLNQGIRRW